MANQPLDITFLGTGTSTGVPVVACNCPVCTSGDYRDRRYRTSLKITSAGKNIIIDCGPDFRIQMLRHKVDDLEAVIFTHAHRDHIAGLDDIRAYNFILNKSISIYGSSETLEAIREQFPYIFSPGLYMGGPRINLNTLDENPFTLGGLSFTPIKVMHQFMEVYGYRIGDFTYITDANAIAPEEMKKIEGTKTLIINALRKSRHPSHFSLAEALQIVEQIQPDTAYLTHISHFLGKHEDVQQQLPPGVFLAYDGLHITAG